jgi:glycosyltransferase involved in cell wall biosynthesis
MFRWSTGALPISHEIEHRIKKHSVEGYPTFRIPVIVDPKEIISKTAHINDNSDSNTPVFFWCGMADGYLKDIFFLLDALSLLTGNRGKASRLRIAGPCSHETKSRIISYSSSKHVHPNRVDITGFISDEELWRHCKTADALLMPMWDNDRSMTRFPTKLGLFLASGRPIVTSRVGEIRHFLTNETAFFYSPGDASSLSKSLDYLLKNPDKGIQLSSYAQKKVMPLIDYRTNAKPLSDWADRIYRSNKLTTR